MLMNIRIISDDVRCTIGWHRSLLQRVNIRSRLQDDGLHNGAARGRRNEPRDVGHCMKEVDRRHCVPATLPIGYIDDELNQWSSVFSQERLRVCACVGLCAFVLYLCTCVRLCARASVRVGVCVC